MAFGYALSILGDSHLAEDASQEAFVEAYRCLDQLRDRRAFGAWLRTIVLKHCDRITRRKRPPVVDLDLAGSVMGKDSEPREMLESSEMRRQILDAIRSLPATIRETMMLYYFAGHRHDQVAAFLGVPPGTVTSRLHRGRKLLQGKLLDLADEVFCSARPSRNRTFEETIMQIIAPREVEQGKALYEFMDAEDAQWRLISPSEYAEGRIHESHYDWKASRLGVKDGRIVGVWNTYDITMRIGSAKVKVAGENCSKTHSDHRGGSVEMKLSRAVFDSARDHGYDLAVTFEHGDGMALKQQLGYHDVWRECWWFVPTCDLPTEPAQVDLIEFTHFCDVPAVADVFNRWNDGVTGTAVRPTFRRSKHPEIDAPGYYWKDDRGEPVGYIRPGYHPDGLKHGLQGVWTSPALAIDDHAGDPQQVIRVIAELARDRKLETVWFIRMGYQSPMGIWLRRHESFRLLHTTIRYMARVINLHQVLSKMTGELERRIADSVLAGGNESLTLCCEDQAATIRIDGGRVSVTHGESGPNLICGDHAVAKLLVGGDEPRNALALPGTQTSGRAAALAAVLFPNEFPQLNYSDL